jgi:hypothetical protein
VRVFAALLFFVFFTAASAPKYRANWVTLLTDGARGRLIFPKGELVKIGRVVPARLFQLSSQPKFEKGTFGFLGAGTLMVPVDGTLRKFCRLERHMGSAFACLSDDDGDGQLDSFFGTQVFKEFFTGSVGDDGGQERLLEPVAFAEVDAFEKSPEIDLEFVFRGGSKDGISFQLCLSKKIQDNAKFYQSNLRRGFSIVCSTLIRLPSRSVEQGFEGFGAQFEFARATKEAVEAKVVPSSSRSFETSSGFK